jgi:hypothetical protein
VSRSGLFPLPFIVCLLVLGDGPVPQAQNAPPRPDPIRRVRSPIAGRYIVALRGGADPAVVGSESAKLHRGRLRHAYRRVLHGFSIDLTESAAQALARDPRIAYVQEDGVTTGDAVSEQVDVQSWGLDRIDQRARPLDGRYRHSSSGTGVNVYVIDSGIRTTHASFQGRAFGAYNAIGDGIPADVDCNGHGTHVAGIVGSDDVGVAKGVLLYSVKALGCNNFGSWSAYIDAIDWVATNHRKPAVINASIGGDFIPAAADAIQAAVEAGITFVGSAGNQSVDACAMIPGGAPESITVGNSTAGDERASDSNYGPCVDLFAPGSSIYSASHTTDTAYTHKWGTSMAAPHVAGAAALYLEGRPGATPSEVRSALVAGATPGIVTNHGPGSPNLLLFSPHLGDAVAPAVIITSPTQGAVVRGVVAVQASAADDVELATVRFSVDGTSLGADSAPPFAVWWDTTQFTNATHTITAEAEDRAGNLTRRTIAATVSNGDIQQGSPFAGVPAAIPGLVQAESFDEGGQSVGHYDLTPGNKGGVFRPTDVDVAATDDVGGGYYVGWTSAGEWLQYAIKVATTGTYTLETRVANLGTGGTFHVEVDGLDRTGPIALPDTGGWQTWRTIATPGIPIAAGERVMRVVLDRAGSGGGVGNYNWFRLVGSTTTPYGGTPAAIPGIVQAENFDEGARSVTHYDLTPGNKGGAYRSTDVDVAAAIDNGGGHYVGWTPPGEWLKYTVKVAATGTYTLDTRVANIGTGGTFHVEVDDVDRTGPIGVPDTGGWQTWQTIRTPGISLTQGEHVMRVVFDRASSSGGVGNYNWFRLVGSNASPTPYGGTPAAVPGTVEAEHFDEGGQSVGHYDLTPGNKGGLFRPTDVDLAAARDVGGGYYVGWTPMGEWLNYTVKVAATGTYTLDTRVANIGTGGAFHVEVDGVDRTGPIAVPDTGGWQAWQTITTQGIPLAAGERIIRVVFDKGSSGGGVGNYNWFRFSGSPSATP